MLLQLHEPGQTPLPHHQSRCIVGIDLGTTHSLVAVADKDKATIVVGKTPSVIARKGQTYLVGHEALSDPQALFSVKRLMSNPNSTIKMGQDQFPLTPPQASAEILKYLKKKAETEMGMSLREIVLTVPAYFDETARTATRDAARMAGLEVVRMINEPTAAALAYGLDQGAEGLYGVYDWGGGTFDFSLLWLEKGVFQVLATGGDTQLGGDDIDESLQKILPSSLTLLEIRALKEKLTYATEVDEKGIRLTRDMLDQQALPLVKRTLDICTAVLKDAALTTQDLKGLVLVGGASRMSVVHQAVEELFQHPPLTTINPDEAVALGAAYQGYALASGTGTLLLDVCPLSLGLEMMGGTVNKIIPRNSPIPTSVTEEFTTYHDGQTGLLIHVLQGERELVANCRSLAKFELQGIPPAPAGYPRIQVTFTLDADGLLSVSAFERATGIRQSVEVKPTYGLAQTDIEEFIQASYENAKKDLEAKALQESLIEAQRLKQATQAALESDRDLLETTELQTIYGAMQKLDQAFSQPHTLRLKEAAKQLEQATHAFAEKRLNRTLAQAFKGTSIKDL